jgi:hypothetical protein
MMRLSQGDRMRLELEGARLAPLIVGWRWIDRRVESVTYLSETRALREISITFTLPDRMSPAVYTGPIEGAQAELPVSPPAVELPRAGPHRHAPAPSASAAEPDPPGGGFYYVPLTLIDKGKMTRFDFTDECGASLPLLGSGEKGVMGAGLLVALAEWVLGEAAMSLPTPIADELRTIAEYPQKQAAGMRERFMDGSQARSAEEEKAFAILRGKSRNARVLRALVAAFAHCYIMVVPLAQGPQRKRMIKFSYEENIMFHVAPQLEGGYLHRRKQMGIWLATELTRTFGWRARQIWLAAPAFGHGGTYHLEMSAPPGIKITQMTLVGLTVTPAMNEQDIDISAPLEEQYVPHVICREKKPGAFAVAYAKMRLTSPTVLRAAFTSALGTALALYVGYHFLAHLLTEGGGLTGAGAALLLAVPTAASIYISRVQEHPMVTNMLFGVRLASLLSGASAFAAASVLILGPQGNAKGNWLEEAETAWLICLAAAAIAALVLGGAFFATWKEDQPLRSRWRRYTRRWATPPTFPPRPPEQ